MALKAVYVSDVPHLDHAPAPTLSLSLHPAAASAAPQAPKPASFTVIGHRGNGMNAPSPSSDPRPASFKENTVLSFNHTARFPVDSVEFDVQVTRDGCPVVFHDIHILTGEPDGLSEKRVTDLPLHEFLSYGPQRESGKAGKPLLRRTQDGRVFDWIVEADDPLCTLQEAFERVDPHLGFNIELKFDDDTQYDESDLSRALQLILRVALDHAGDRPVMFSTFHPDAARLMRRLQSMYPVFFLTDAGTEIYDDERRNSLEAAMELCSESGLQGIVSEVRGVLRDPAAIARIKEAGLVILTYGELNNVPEAVYMQHLMGIDGVIADRVGEITEAVSELIGEGTVVGEEARPRFSQRELSFLLKLIPELVQR